MKEFLESNKEDRKNRIINAALEIITTDGYTSMNLDHVVTLAGTSKSAIYELFKNKEGLLKAVCAKTTFDSRQLFSESVSIEMPVSEYLSKYINLYVELCHMPSYAAVIRTVFTQTSNSSSLGKYYFSITTQRTVTELAQYFELKISEGKLKPMNSTVVARRVVGALVWYQEAKLLFLVDEVPDISEMRELADDLLESFLESYSTEYLIKSVI